MKTILINEPQVPYMGKLHGTPKEGTIFRVKIKLLENGSHFRINLRSGSNPINDNIPLHLSLRPGNNPDYMRNTAINAAWGKEESSIGMPLQINVLYEVQICCQKESFKIIIEGINEVEYKYRSSIDTIDHISVFGAGKIYSIMEQYDGTDEEFHKCESNKNKSVLIDMQKFNSIICNQLFIRMPKQIIFNYDNEKDDNAKPEC